MARSGAGAWGTGLAIAVGRKGSHLVRLWAHDKQIADAISKDRVNEKFLPGQSIPDCASVTSDLEEALRNAEIVVGVMPSQHSRHLFQEMRPHLKSGMLIVSATKGLEQRT